MKLNLSRRFKNNSDLLLTVALALGILAAINFFAGLFYWRHDLTAGGWYSLSPATISTLKNLPDVVNVRVYFSRDLPSQFLPTRQTLTDVLNEYAGYNHKFQVKFIDPGDGQAALAAGIPKLQFNDWRQDKLEVVNGYMGLTLSYRDKNEVVPAVQNVANFEYELTSRLKKLTGQSPTIGILGGHGTADSVSDWPLARREMSKLYELETVSALRLPDHLNSLLIVAPTGNFSDDELKNLDAFLMRGHSIIVAVDGVSVGANLVASANRSNIFDWLAKYGLTVNHDLIMDASAGAASFNQGLVTFSLAYPYWPKIVAADFDQNNPLVAGLDGVVLPWASSISVDQSKMTDETKVAYLAKSSPKAWLAKDDWQLNPSQGWPRADTTSQYNLVVGLSGKIKSVYGDQSTGEGRLWVAGDGDFFQDNFWQGNQANLVLAQNLLDGASLSVDLAGIRVKKIENRSLLSLNDATKELARYLNIFGITAIVLAGGLWRYFLRRRTKKIEI